MSNLLSFLLIFIIALAIGVFIGKLIFSAKSQSEKSILEEKLNNLKEQSLVEKTTLERQLQQSIQEKESIRTEKEAYFVVFILPVHYKKVSLKTQ